MPEEKPTQVLKLANREVWEWAGLAAFFANYTNANMCSLNHVDIVCAVSDRQRCLSFTVSAYELDQGRLLLRWWSVYNEAFGL